MTANSPIAFPTTQEATNAFLRGVYRWMGAGLALTAVTAWIVMNSRSVLALLFRPAIFNLPFFFVLLIAELILVIALTAVINRISSTVAALMFVVYSLLNGFTLSPILLAYTQASVVQAFVSTAVMFGVMSVYSIFTKRDLSSWGAYLMMGLFGLIISSVVNLFFASTALDFFLSVSGVVIFLGLTAYDTQRLLRFGQNAGDGEIANKACIMGALALYLDFINLFLKLLRLFGRKR